MTFLQSCRQGDDDQTVIINPEEFSVSDMNKIGAAFQEAILLNPEINVLDRFEYPEAYDFIDQRFMMLVNTDKVKHRRDFYWNISILNDDNVQTAFALPGGHMFIYTGMLKHLKSEAQLESVLAHEIFYADNEVGIQQLKSEFGGIVLGDLILGNNVPNIREMAASMPNLAYSPDDVMSADEFAVDIICQFNYHARALNSILEDFEYSDILWESTRPVDNIESRMDAVIRNSAECSNTSEYVSRYRTFVREMLPQ